MACNTRRYAGNVVGLPMIVRMGGNDTTVPPVNLVRPECGYSVVCGSVCGPVWRAVYGYAAVGRCVCVVC